MGVVIRDLDGEQLCTRLDKKSVQFYEISVAMGLYEPHSCLEQLRKTTNNENQCFADFCPFSQHDYKNQGIAKDGCPYGQIQDRLTRFADRHDRWLNPPSPLVNHSNIRFPGILWQGASPILLRSC